MGDLDLEEKMMVGMLRKRVGDLVQEDYFRTEAYLINWIRARDLEVDKAEEMIRNAFTWRKENNIDNILTEEMDEYIVSTCPYKLDGKDKDGRPLLMSFGGKWNIKDIIESEKLGELHRFVYRMAEEILQLIKKSDHKTTGGKFTIVVDLDGFTQTQLSSKGVITAIQDMVAIFRDNYPGLMNECYIVNCPMFFTVFYNMMKASFAPGVEERIFLYGTDRSEWEDFLTDVITPEQIIEYFGEDPEAAE